MNLELLFAAHEHPLSSADIDQLNETLTPFDTYIGLAFTHVESARVVAEVAVTDRIQQPFGLVNGGVFSSISETVGSIAGMVAAAKPVVGMSNSTEFLSSVREGTIVAEATTVHAGTRTQLWRIELRNDDRLVAVTHLRTMVLDR